MKAGDAGLELLSELKAVSVSGVHQIPAMDDKRVRGVTDSVREAFRNVESVATNPYAVATEPFYASSIQFHRAKALRYKRCLITYLSWRLDCIGETWWDAREHTLTGNMTRAAAAPSAPTTSASSSLSPGEAVYLRDYGGLMVEYMMSFAVPLDFRAFSWRPPSSSQVCVVGLKSCSFVSPLTGLVHTMYEGKRLRLNLEEAEQLLVQGIAQLVEE
jgi:GINS complex subunit 1